MEEGMKDGGEKPREARTADKAGWIKKSSGGFLGLWKDRYLLLCQAQLLVYENEDEQKCVETVELGSYEKCQDLRALLKRKHRFILLRSPGNKVSNIKFQAPSGEEKESWIKALNEGINRGKNKAFDEVKVDKSCALEHVTRDRVRGGQRRRPPTRVHLKEVANAASDGLSRLDLDVLDSGPPVFAPSNDVNAAQPREALRPPMPPTKTSPAPEMTSLGDKAETPAGERAPTPISASSEAHPESQEDSETAVKKDSGSEQPPNRVLPDKLKESLFYSYQKVIPRAATLNLITKVYGERNLRNLHFTDEEARGGICPRSHRSMCGRSSTRWNSRAACSFHPVPGLTTPTWEMGPGL